MRGVRAGLIGMSAAALIACGPMDSDARFSEIDATHGTASDNGAPEKLLNFCHANEECGYMNSDGEVIVPAVYQDTSPFQDGMGVFKQDNKWGAMNEEGEVVIPPNFPASFSFWQGRASISHRGKTIHLNREGEVVLRLPLRAMPFSLLSGNRGTYSVAFLDQKWGVLDGNGVWVLPPNYSYIFPFSGSENRYAVVTPEGHQQLIDTSGNVIASPLCGFFAFQEGLAPVWDASTCSKPLADRLKGYIDYDGKWIIPPAFEEAHWFSEGLARVKYDGKFGFIDRSGKVAIETSFTGLGDYSEGLAAVRIGPIEKIERQTEEGSNASTEELLERVRKLFKWGFINKQGNVVIEPKYEKVREFSEGLSRVEIDGKVGFIDKEGKIVVPIVFDNASSFAGGYALVEFGQQQYYVSRTGSPIGFKYEDMPKIRLEIRPRPR